jgi:two-component system response regulator (stage 0 sporulation protein A)
MDSKFCKPKYRAILADHNRDYLRLVAGYLNETGLFVVEDYAFDGRQAYEMTRELKPDLLVLDLLMPMLDGFAVLEELAMSGYAEATKVAMTSVVALDFVLKKAESYHVDYVFIKPFEKEVFKRRLVEMMCHDSKAVNVADRIEPRADDIVTRHIKTVGITANIKGYYYLRDAILMVHEDSDLMSRLTTGLYALVANKYNSTPQRVERAMRHAIETAWNRGNIKVLEEFFGYTILDSKGKPTNGEFIAMLADKLNTELRYVD